MLIVPALAAKARSPPVIKKQAISAYDPRVIEVTGLSMMVTAQGADHTAGNVPRVKSREKELDELMEASLNSQVNSAATDSLGLCVFGRSVTDVNTDFLADTINHALGTNLEPSFFEAFEDDELPAFFYNEPLHPSNHVARFHGYEVHNIYDRL